MLTIRECFPLSGKCIQSVVIALTRTRSRYFYSASSTTMGDTMSLMYQRRWWLYENIPHTSTTCNTSQMPCLDICTVCTTGTVAINVNVWFLQYIWINIVSINNNWHQWSWYCFLWTYDFVDTFMVLPILNHCFISRKLTGMNKLYIYKRIPSI